MLEYRYPHFKKSQFSHNMKYSAEMPSICICVCMKMFLTVVIKDEHTSNDSLQSGTSFLLHNSMIAAKTLKFSFLHAVYIEVRAALCALLSVIRY